MTDSKAPWKSKTVFFGTVASLITMLQIWGVLSSDEAADLSARLPEIIDEALTLFAIFAAIWARFVAKERISL